MQSSMDNKHPVTVADVARAAKVSKATAARVLGGYGVVSERAREAVLEAAKALSYQPNEIARSMSTGRSGLIGVIVGDIENAYFSLAVRGISDAARAAGFNVIIANSDEKIAVEKATVDVMLRKRVDGLIVTPCNDSDIAHLLAVQKSGLPLVLFDRWISALSVDAVTGDDRHSATVATQRLVAAGHRRIAYITALEEEGVKLEMLRNTAVRERIGGFLEVLRAAGVAEPERLVGTGARGQARTSAIVSDMLEGADPVTAIIASDSLVGLETFSAIRALGKSIPDDVSLVSYFDADWTRVTAPEVTVVDQPIYELGKSAADLLLARISGGHNEHRRLVVPTRLIERGSIGGIPKRL